MENDNSFRPVEFRPRTMVEHTEDVLNVIKQKIRDAGSRYDNKDSDKDSWLEVLERLHRWQNTLMEINTELAVKPKRRQNRRKTA